MADDGLFLCLRIPKSGSQSLVQGLQVTFAGRHIFYVPNTLDPDSSVSPLQRLRFLRARYQNLFRHYRTLSMTAVWARIAQEAEPGDLLMGGHVDFRTASANLSRPLKMIALLRDPIARARAELDYMRRGYARKYRLNRFVASVLHKKAGRLDFDSYLDFLHAHRTSYGDIACQYLGWNGSEGLPQFFARNVFHCGVLEEGDDFARGLSEKLERPFALPRTNRTAGERVPLTRSQRAMLEQIYARDIELYQWASKSA
jgi:hypothetical protein